MVFLYYYWGGRWRRVQMRSGLWNRLAPPVETASSWWPRYYLTSTYNLGNPTFKRLWKSFIREGGGGKPSFLWNLFIKKDNFSLMMASLTWLQIFNEPQTGINILANFRENTTNAEDPCERFKLCHSGAKFRSGSLLTTSSSQFRWVLSIHIPSKREPAKYYFFR